MTSSTHSSDKHSPHTSPRFSRRSTTPSLMAVQNDLYAGHIPTLSLAAQQQQQQQASATANYISAASVLTGVSGGGGHQPSPSAPPMNVVNGSNQHQQQLITTTITSSSSNVVMPSQKSTNRMSAPLMGTNAVIVGGYGSKISSKTDSTNDNSSSSYAILQNLQESPGIISKEAQKREANSVAIASATSTVSTPSSSSSSVAPPLPPRKSSPGAENSITSPTNGHANNGGVGGGGGGAVQKISLPQTSKSVDNIAATLGDICVPKTTAPPIPPHNTTSSHVDTLVEELRTQRLTNTVVALATANNTTASSNTSNVTTLLDDDIVGPAETIMGVIDTRPLEVRSAAAAASANYTQLQLCTTTTTTSSSMMVVVNSSNCNARSDSKVANNERSSSATISETPKLATNQHQQQHQHHHQHQHQHQQPSQPLLYENISINQKVGDCTVPYENINLEYIARLMNEGYSKENAITALGISRNNIEMACDILREFVAKNSV